MKMNFLTISYSLIAITTPWIGMTLFGLGVPTLGYILGLLILLLNSIYYKKILFNNIHEGYYLIYFYFLLLLISSLFTYSHVDTFIEIITFLFIFLFLSLLNFEKVDINYFMKIAFFSALTRSLLELFYSFTHIEEWTGRYMGFMRFSVAHYGGDPNNIALVISAVLIYIFYKKSFMYYLLSIPIIIHIFMLLSRGALLSVFLGSMIYVIIIKKRLVYIWYLFILFILFILSIYVLYTNEFINISLETMKGEDNSAQVRFVFWNKVFDEMTIKSFFLGIGPRTFAEYYGHWMHNSYIGRLSDLGIFGFFTYLSIILVSLYVYYEKRSIYFISFFTLAFGSFFIDFYQNSLLWFFIGYGLLNKKKEMKI